MLPLRELQLQFMAVLAEGARQAGARADTPRSAAAIDPALLEVVNGRGELGAGERLGIYADMYRARLVDVLREDFPRVLAVLGDDEFAAVACRYLARCPSRHPSVRHVGRRFADFLAADPSAPPFLADLGRLEWARVEVFDASDAEPLRLADLQSVSPAAWPSLRFRRVPASVAVESAWPVHRIWGDTSGDVSLARLEPEATTLRVWREEGGVSHAAMGAAELRAFLALERGEAFAGLCAAVEAGGGDPDAAAREMGAILLRWIEDGLLARLDPWPRTTRRPG